MKVFSVTRWMKFLFFAWDQSHPNAKIQNFYFSRGFPKKFDGVKVFSKVFDLKAQNSLKWSDPTPNYCICGSMTKAANYYLKRMINQPNFYLSCQKRLSQLQRVNQPRSYFTFPNFTYLVNIIKKVKKFHFNKQIFRPQSWIQFVVSLIACQM